MRTNIPIGVSRMNRLEFKGAKALEDLRSLARAVVALLNANGGQLWIGLTERESVAEGIDPVTPLHRQASRLQDGLIDLVEPPPILGEEIAIVPVPVPEGSDAGLLMVNVKPGRRGPYAFLNGVMRGYVVRAGSRTRPMTRDELRSKFSRGDDGDVRDTVSAAMLKEQSELARNGYRGLQLLIQPATSTKLELPLDRPVLEPLLCDAAQTGNRPLGWVFVHPQGELKPARGGVTFGSVGSPDLLLIQRSGRIRYREEAERLYWSGGPDEIWPYALMEFPTSVLRLASRLYANPAVGLDPDSPVVLALALFGIKGKVLRPHSPRAIGYLTAVTRPYEEDALIPDPVVCSWEDLRVSPDRCAFRLVSRIYEAFGYFEDALPAEFSRETGQLTIPS